MAQSEEQVIEGYLDQLNGYLGRPRQYYNHATGKYAIGSFYLDKTIDRKGKRALRINEVLTEDGTYRGYAQYGLKAEEIRIWIDGLTTGINIQRGIAK